MTAGNNLTTENILKTVITFTVPFLLANLIQALYGAADLMVIGWYCSSESVAAVSTGTQVTQIITSIISGLTLGGTVLIGKYVGMEKTDDIKETISTNLTAFIIAGAVLSVLLFVFAAPILTALKTPESSFGLAKEYVRVCSCGVIFICGYNAISAVLRGYGDSKSPLIFVAVSGVLNFFGDIILVKYLNLGVSGTALATILSQGISMFLAMAYLNKKDFVFRFRLKSFSIHRQKLKELAFVGIPITLQECMVRFSFLYLTSVTNNLGVNAAAAVGIASKYAVFAMLPATSVANALAAIVAQNYGAGKYKRMSRALFTGILFALPFSLIFFFWAQISSESMIGIFSNEDGIIRTGIPFFRTCSFDYIAVLFVFCLNGYLNGRSMTIFTMISSCFGAAALRIPLIYLLCSRVPDNLGVIGMAAPSVSAIMAVYTLIFVVLLIRRDNKYCTQMIKKLPPV